MQGFQVKTKLWLPIIIVAGILAGAFIYVEEFGTDELRKQGRVITGPTTIMVSESEEGTLEQDTSIQFKHIAKEELPENLVEIKISSIGLEPKEFTVKQGEEFRLIFWAIDDDYIIEFDKPFSHLKKSITKEQKRGVVLTTNKIGDYIFYCFNIKDPENKKQGVMYVE